MSKQKETRFKIKVQKALDLFGPGVWYVKIQQVTIRGTPDLLICAWGVFVAWELKVGGNTATPLQQHNLDGIAKAGGHARVVTPENLEQELQALWFLKGLYESKQLPAR